MPGRILKLGITTGFARKVMQAMSMNLSNGISKVLRILRQTERPQARTGTPSVRHVEAEELQVSAHNYYQSIIQNSLVSNKNYEPPKSQSNTGSQSALTTQGSDHDHWFDQRSQNKGHKAKDSNYRLQAFLQPGKVKELKTLDKNYLKRQGS
ncbi:MAG TPA: hypothetical protein EYN91_09365 [Candidatus Melainabacteria bacterium]|nr:hypothetical protein [Candidatus Melainabacteria bacterium]